MNYYSATTNGFYSSENEQAFHESGNWPDDAVAISDALYNKMMSGQSAGMVVVASDSGLPELQKSEQPEPAQEALIEVAEAEKSRLLSDATAIIAPLQDAVDLGIATDDETASLVAWKKYRVMLNRVDTSMAPDIEWPASPKKSTK
ncbi:tail fiber assembly protein [Enterobacteriaceae bacterium BIT-l23]|uniref:tail fiber assembly protein n=1 Tax=Jejubacter sp. L23 TaxID=3092086 RepID=UPI001584DFA2|nr:tail fiber assembly protein [Enterobacteriaceae bacterium BIT-l23]